MIVLIGIGITYTLYNMFYKQIAIGMKINFAPFNCQFCISFWVSLALFIWSLDPLCLTLPLAYNLVTRLLNKI